MAREMVTTIELLLAMVVMNQVANVRLDAD